MAVKSMNMANEYNGLSTDVKPLDGVYQGSIFLEIDTGNIYIYDSASGSWIKQFSLQGE